MTLVISDALRGATLYEADGGNLPGGRAHITARGGDVRFDDSARGGGEELPGPAADLEGEVIAVHAPRGASTDPA